MIFTPKTADFTMVNFSNNKHYGAMKNFFVKVHIFNKEKESIL